MANQQQPYANGTKVLYGVYHNDDAPHDMRTEAVIRGFTHLDGGLYYVLQTENDSKLFIRPHNWVTLAETTLSEYVSAYIKHELSGYNGQASYELLNLWVANAFEAYEGGAR